MAGRTITMLKQSDVFLRHAQGHTAARKILAICQRLWLIVRLDRDYNFQRRFLLCPSRPSFLDLLTAWGAASRLVVRTQPTGALSGAPLVTQPVVEVRDAKGAAVPEADRPTVGKILGLLRSQIN